MNMPLIKVVVPATPYDVKGLLKAAIRDDNPVVFLNQLSLGGQRGEVPDEEYIVPLGRADIKRQGRDVTICAAGLTVHRSLAAAETLARDGIEAEVIDLRTLKPWDVETVLQSVKRTGRFVAVDEAFPVCSAASEWAATVAEKGFGDLVAPTQRVANKPVPIPFNPALESKVLPGVEDIVEAVNRVVSWKGGN